MASTKNNNTTSNNNANESGGFKTAAFGFDKNDVNLYIANLRKKMKSMEEEFEQKLANALDNPAASNEALKHEREVIRSELERSFNDKIRERTSIIKSQQKQIDDLRRQLSESNEKVESLNAQLTAAMSSNGSEATANARAAKAYMQFVTELRSIANSTQKTLATMKETWSGAFDDVDISEITEAAGEDAYTAKPADEVTEAASAPEEIDVQEEEAVKEEISVQEEEAEAPAPIKEKAPAKKAAPPPPPIEFDAEFADMMAGADDEDEGEDDLSAVPFAETKPTEVKKYVKEEVSDDLSALMADDSDEEEAPEKFEPEVLDNELASLLADSAEEEETDDNGEYNVQEIAPPKTGAAQNDDGSDLLADILAAPEEPDRDLSALIEEQTKKEYAELDGLLVVPDAEKEVVGGDEFPVEPSDGRYEVKGGDALNVDSIDAKEIAAQAEAEAEAKKKAAAETAIKKEDDLFDFSFMSGDSEEENDEDMSSDVSFPGSL